MTNRNVTVERKSLYVEALPPTAATAAERIKMVWPLTVEAWAMRGIDITETRLLRHIVHVARRGN